MPKDEPELPRKKLVTDPAELPGKTAEELIEEEEEKIFRRKRRKARRAAAKAEKAAG